jgi:CO/xanthine dehydrogenase FAD-binding subunit
VRVEGGAIAAARVAVGSVGPRAVLAAEAGKALTGAPVENTDPLRSAGALAAEAAGAVEDANGSVEYKEQLVRVLVERCVREALS